MKNFRDLLNEHLKNPELKKWYTLEEEYEFLMCHSTSEKSDMTMTTLA